MRVEQVPQVKSFSPVSIVLTFETQEELDIYKDVVAHTSPVSIEKARFSENDLSCFDKTLWSQMNLKIYQLISRL